MESKGSIDQVTKMFARSSLEDKIYKQDVFGNTKLHHLIAHEEDYERQVLKIIKCTGDKSQLNIVNGNGNSVLHIATMTRSSRVIQCLIRKGANPCLRNKYGKTALHLACEYNDIESVSALTYRESPDDIINHAVIVKFPKLEELKIYNHEGETCLHIAVINNNKPLVHQLLLYGANVEAQMGKCGYTALHIAATSDFLGIAELLLKKWKAKVNALTYGRRTTLDLAIYQKHHRMAALLRKHGGRRTYADSDDDLYFSDASE